MALDIPLTTWQPLSVVDVACLFAHAPFQWGLAGGYAVEQFVGAPIRAHGDTDVLVFRDEQHRLQLWLKDWLLYAADPPGTLRPWLANESLPYGIHDIWGHRKGAPAWQLQIMLAETEGDEWVSRRHPLIRGPRDNLLTVYRGLPCIRVEVQLMYKARHRRPKDELDFQACLPLMSPESKRWLRDQLWLLYPEGHPWIERLASADNSPAA